MKVLYKFQLFLSFFMLKDNFNLKKKKKRGLIAWSQTPKKITINLIAKQQGKKNGQITMMDEIIASEEALIMEEKFTL